MNYVLGLGNVLMGDDGFGPAVVRRLEHGYDVGPNVTVVDLGTPGLDMTPWLADADDVVIVDTVGGDAPPGTLRIYDKEDLLAQPPPSRVSPHDPGLKETLSLLELAGHAPHRVTLIGVVPEQVDPGIGLSPAIARAVPGAVDLVAATLHIDPGCRHADL